MSAHSPYEQLKDDFGYLGLDAAACSATLAEQAMAEAWPPVVYLERVMADGDSMRRSHPAAHPDPPAQPRPHQSKGS